MRSRHRIIEPVRKNGQDKRGQPRLSFTQRLKSLHMRLGVALSVLSVLLMAAAGIVYLSIYQQGDTASDNARQLLTEYNQEVSQCPAVSPSPASALPLPAVMETMLAASATSSPSPDDYMQPSAPDVDPSTLTVSLPGYDVIGKLVISKIGVDLPVISETTAKALKVSICWYEGALPGEKGNMVITGHNYANGAHFGKLSKLEAGDEVEFDAPDGKNFRYTVYQTLTVTPDNLDALNKYEGDYDLTLVTCQSSGNRRLLVRCKLES